MLRECERGRERVHMGAWRAKRPDDPEEDGVRDEREREEREREDREEADEREREPLDDEPELALPRRRRARPRSSRTPRPERRARRARESEEAELSELEREGRRVPRAGPDFGLPAALRGLSPLEVGAFGAAAGPPAAAGRGGLPWPAGPAAGPAADFATADGPAAARFPCSCAGSGLAGRPLVAAVARAGARSWPGSGSCSATDMSGRSFSPSRSTSATPAPSAPSACTQRRVSAQMPVARAARRPPGCSGAGKAAACPAAMAAAMSRADRCRTTASCTGMPTEEAADSMRSLTVRPGSARHQPGARGGWAGGA